KPCCILTVPVSFHEGEMKPSPPELEAELRSGLFTLLVEPLKQGIADLDRLAAEIGVAALDPNLFGGGGTAVLWEDLLSLEDVATVVGGALKPLAPKTQVELLLKLVLFWRKLRNVRVALGKEEYQILRAVKQKPGTVAELAAQLGKPEAE